MLRTLIAVSVFGAGLVLAACDGSGAATRSVRSDVKVCEAVASYAIAQGYVAPGSVINPIVEGTPPIWDELWDDYLPRPSYRYIGQEDVGFGPWLSLKQDQFARDTLISQARAQSALPARSIDCRTSFEKAGLEIAYGPMQRMAIARAGNSVSEVSFYRPVWRGRWAAFGARDDHNCTPSGETDKPFAIYGGGRNFDITRWDGRKWARVWNYGHILESSKSEPVEACE